MMGYESQENGNAGLTLGNCLGTSLAFPCNMSSMPEQQVQQNQTKNTPLQDDTFAIGGIMKGTSYPQLRTAETGANPSFPVRICPRHNCKY
jgi:hypothetical protein